MVATGQGKQWGLSLFSHLILTIRPTTKKSAGRPDNSRTVLAAGPWAWPSPSIWGKTTPHPAGARLRLSRAYLAGGADQEATAAGDAATGFDFGDAAHMAAELAPMLGGAPAGQRGR